MNPEDIKLLRPKRLIAENLAIQSKDINKPEAIVLTDSPMLSRVPSTTNPRVMTVPIHHNHNPDFMLFHYHVEVKGRHWKLEWVRALANLDRPDRYKIVLCSSSDKERRRLISALRRHKAHVEYVHIEDKDKPWASRWVTEALQDWLDSTEEERLARTEQVQRITKSTPAWTSIRPS